MDEPPAKRIKLAENDASVDVKLTESLSNNAVETESKVEQTTNVDDVRQSDSGKENSLTKTKKKKVFKYGNYEHYYGYRKGHSNEIDKRVKLFRKEWFDGKKVLDIGCNAGLVTLDIAREFNVAYILGGDIDEGLIKRANKNLNKIVDQMQSVTESTDATSTVETSKNRESKPAKPLKQRVKFKAFNFVAKEATPNQMNRFDVILCLSVVKWIHLNWGDEGLVHLFRKVFQQLVPGGLFIFEPQEWSSYQKKRKISEELRANFKKIKIKPDSFLQLLEKMGFELMESLYPEEERKGFKRPIYVLRKSLDVLPAAGQSATAAMEALGIQTSQSTPAVTETVQASD